VAAAPAAAKETAPASVTATPALWTIKGQGVDITILASIHMLPRGVVWRSATIDAAMSRAAVVVFETPVSGAGASDAQRLMAERGALKDGQTLDRLLTPQLWKRLEDAAWKIGVPAKMLKGFEPWMAAITLEVMNYLHRGFSPWLGVDHTLETEAKTAGKTLAYFETAGEQIGYLADLPRPVGVRMVEMTVKALETKTDVPDRLIAAWASGDPEKVWRLTEESMGEVPEMAEALLKRRNQNWVPKIERMIASGKPHVIVAGAAHFAGPDSVITLLRAKGHKVEGP
jgi:hypothetical protein